MFRILPNVISKTFTVRIPPELLKDFEVICIENHRSYSRQLVCFIQDGVKKYKERALKSKPKSKSLSYK